jgi:hypothetical protein
MGANSSVIVVSLALIVGVWIRFRPANMLDLGANVMWILVDAHREEAKS